MGFNSAFKDLMYPPETTVLENQMTMNYELGRMWKESKWRSTLRRTTRFSVTTDSNQTIISNEEFHKEESEILVLEPTFSVIFS
jgi:hypothetical protein